MALEVFAKVMLEKLSHLQDGYLVDAITVELHLLIFAMQLGGFKLLFAMR
jgi:hypothetical protein